MNKGKVIGTLKQHGDVIITYIDPKTRHRSYSCCTLEFKNTYIKTQTKGKKPWPKVKTDIVVFNWTENRYWILNPKHVKELQPLSSVLQNAAAD